MEKPVAKKIGAYKPAKMPIRKVNGSNSVPRKSAESLNERPTEFSMVPIDRPVEQLETREIIQEAKKKEAEELKASEVVQSVDKKAPAKKRVAKTKSTTIAKLDGGSVSAEAIGKLVSDLPAGEGIKYKIVAIKPIQPSI
jgi:hypothetical protein